MLQAYVEDYLTNEVRNEGYVRNITAFSRFLDSTKFSNGEMVNYSNIAREVGIDAKTIKEYYQILVDTLVGYLIYPYAKKVQRAVISHIPKFYYFDVGVASRVAKTRVSALEGSHTGKLLEHYVLMELKAYIGLNDSDYDLFYWRTSTGLEIDFILSDGINAPIPIEVKISQNIHKTELKGLKAFMKEHNVYIGYLICQEQNIRKIEIDQNSAIFILPIKIFLDKLWHHEILSNEKSLN